MGLFQMTSKLVTLITSEEYLVNITMLVLNWNNWMSTRPQDNNFRYLLKYRSPDFGMDVNFHIFVEMMKSWSLIHCSIVMKSFGYRLVMGALVP